MSSNPAYDALRSETSSTSPTLCQPESQLKCEEVESSAVLHTSKICSRTCVSWSWASWEWEFAACLLVLATPIIIFATLYPHTGQPLPQWPFKVSINSLLSVYALALKAAIGFILTSCIGQLQWAWFSETRPLTDMLHFDNATRGADGALSLIWRQKFRQPLTAFGCVLIVLAVIVDPFVQQLIRPVDCSVEVSDNHATATMARANGFANYGYDWYTHVITFGSTEDSLHEIERAVDNALYSAFFSSGQDPPWQCPTGNCTFHDAYGTIGLCYSCQDSSADVIINSTCSHPDSSYASHRPTYEKDCPDNSSFSVESTIIADGFDKLSTKMTISSNGSVDRADVAYATSSYNGRNLLFRLLIGATAGANGRIDWTRYQDYMCYSKRSKRSWACQGYGAATCSLRPCVQIYNATVSAGVLEEQLVASSSDTAWGIINTPDGLNPHIALVDTHCSAGIQPSSNRDWSVGGRWLPYNFSLAETDVDRDFYGKMTGFRFPYDVKPLVNSGCLYFMSVDKIISSVKQHLGGTVQAGLMGMYKESDSSGAWTTSIHDISTFDGPEFIQRIYNWGHTDLERVESYFANISSSLTTHIRAHSSSQKLPSGTNFSRQAEGRLYRFATCLQVQWPWIAFPACLAVVTALFLLTVVEATQRRGASVWKLSPLAWVLRADGLHSEQYSSSTRLCEGMKEVSRSISVRILDEDRDGPRIRMVDIKDPNLL